MLCVCVYVCGMHLYEHTYLQKYFLYFSVYLFLFGDVLKGLSVPLNLAHHQMGVTNFEIAF
jgi:hypothetical protein